MNSMKASRARIAAGGGQMEREPRSPILRHQIGGRDSGRCDKRIQVAHVIVKPVRMSGFPD